MTGTQYKLLKEIQAKGRILNIDESFDFYTDHVMRNSASCYWNPYTSKGKGQYQDYTMWQLKDKANGWYKMNLGSLLIQGVIKLKSKEER